MGGAHQETRAHTQAARSIGYILGLLFDARPWTTWIRVRMWPHDRENDAVTYIVWMGSVHSGPYVS